MGVSHHNPNLEMVLINLVDKEGGGVFNDGSGRRSPTNIPTRQIRIRNDRQLPFTGRQYAAFLFQKSFRHTRSRPAASTRRNGRLTLRNAQGTHCAGHRSGNNRSSLSPAPVEEVTPMRHSSKNGTMANGMTRPIRKNPPGTRIQKKGYGTLEKVLLVLVAASLFIIAVLSIHG